ncbi:DNA polymerase domain-containing protein [Salinirubrum litoreum]|uniref:DNA polymerase n=1 Tax=Salinirubrum litoreum TaxID=1126234 RepID=A0ABD5RCB7_9EURY|nr:DNA polymerase domain-containing protein [Salinirubrum litoreum]
MSDDTGGQSALVDFGHSEADEDRPDAEAAAVAGGVEAAEVIDASDKRFPDADGEIDVAVTQVDYSVEYADGEEYPVVHVFGRDGREPLHVRVLGFEPYFYVPTSRLADRAQRPEDEFDAILDSRETDADGDPFVSIRGEELTKLIGRTPRDVGQLRDEFEEHYEADILFPNRFLIDKDVGSGIRVPARWLDDDETTLQVHHEEVYPVDAEGDLRVNTFDIEVDDRSGFPEDGEEPIVCLTSHDNYRDEYVVWLYEAPEGDGPIPDSLPTYEPLEDDTDIDVRSFETEGAMLDAFVSYVEETDPDVLTGWNFEDFDAPYFLDRLEEVDPETDHDLDPDRLSRIGEVWRSGWGGPDVKGRVVFDLLYGYKRTQFTELESYRLDAVGEVELGVGKERYSGDIGDLWEDDPERLLEYNVRDVELCVELDRKQEIIAFWDEVRQFVGCLLEDAPTPGDTVDVYVLHKSFGRFALPTKGQADAEEYEGGAVFDPITGVKENVTVLDLKCFSEDTDVATPSGIRNIRELEEGDPVYTLNPDTFECEVKPVIDTQSYDNQYGELHHASGNTYDFKVTENHRFLLSKERGWDDLYPEDYEFDAYRDIPDSERFAFPNHEPMSGAQRDRFDLAGEASDGNVVVYAHDGLSSFRAQMPQSVESELDWANGTSRLASIEGKTGKYLLPVETYREHRDEIDEQADELFLKYDRGHAEMPCSFRMDDWLELIGWFVTEGSFTRDSHGIELHQQDEGGRASIRDLLDRMDINYSVEKAGFNISNRFLYDWFADYCGDGYANKRLPAWVFELDATHLRTLLDTLVAGDGRSTESGLQKFWTKSDQLKEDVARLAIQCGEKPTVSKQSDGTWYVSIGKRGSMRKADAEVEDHDGQVHCITAKDNHVVLAGRNGHFQWVGQSLYPMCMVTINASPETKAPDDYDGPVYTAPNGTEFQQEPDGIIREMVDELLTERDEKKARRNEHDPDSEAYQQFDQQQAAVKVIMNCFTPDTDVLTPEGVRNIRDLSVGDDVYSLDPERQEMQVKQVTETHAYPDYRGELVDIETSKTDFRVTPNHRMLVRKDDKNGASWDDYRFVEAGELNGSSHYELPHDWSMDHGEEIEEIDLTELLDGDYEVWVRPEVHGRTFTTELGWTPRRVPKADVGQTGYVFDAEEFERHREYIESVCELSFVHRESGRKWIPRTYDSDDFLELLAWYITEGSVSTSEDKQFGENFRGSATTIQIAQDALARTDGGAGVDTAESDHARIGDLLDRMGFDYYVNDQSYQFTSKLLGGLLERLGGTGSFEKCIPEFVFDASERQKRLFLDTMIAGDGDRQPNSWRYTTSSDRLRDDVLRLCAHLGLTASYGQNGGSWRIYCTEGAKNSFRMHRSGGRSTADEGAYCVTVEDNHTLLAGRNGKFQFVGQSLYGVTGWDRFRLYDKEVGAAVTATGREVIRETEKISNSIGHEVTYGDTDSVMLEIGQLSDDDLVPAEEIPEAMRDANPDATERELRERQTILETGFELESQINDGYDEFAERELNALEHRFQIEFEKLYRRFFQAGKKKRYAGHIVWKEGKYVDDIDITGFEYKRSDIAPITKRVQKDVLEMIVTGTDVDEIRQYLKSEIDAFEDGAVDLDEIGIPGGIGKRLDAYETDTAQVRGAKYANAFLGTNFQRGSKPKRLYLDKVHPDFWRRMEDEKGLDPQRNSLYGEFKADPDVICFEYADQVPDEFEIDYETMLEKTLKGPIARVIEALGMSWDEVKSGQEQTGLGSFM